MESLFPIFGGAIITFYLMWLWLKSIQDENKKLKSKLDDEQEARIKELKEMLPLLMDTSRGLQSVIKTNNESSTEVIESIKGHIDEKVKEISEKCNKKK